MLDYVTCVAGFEKGRGIGTEGKKGMSLGRDGPLFARFLPSSPCLPVSLSPCPSSVLRLPGRLWATWVCAAQQGMVFAPLALKQGMKITLLSLLSLPKNRWHYWGSFSARLLFFLRVSSSRFTIDVRGRVTNSKRNKPRASKTQQHTPIVNFSEYPSPFPPTPLCCAGWSSKSVHDLEIWIGKGRENKRGWLDSQLSFSDDVKYGD